MASLDREFSQQNLDDIPTTPTSPKAKSAPATPCNVTPTAFLQHHNTLPLDIRKTCRQLTSSVGHSSPQYLDELRKRGEGYLEAEDFQRAIESFSECIDLAEKNQNQLYLKENFNIFSQRAEAQFHLRNFKDSYLDSIKARELNPNWIEAYFQQGRAQFKLGHQIDSLAAFAYGLSYEPTNLKLFEALIDASLKCKIGFELEYNQLEEANVNKIPFIVVSVLGQRLLAKGFCDHAVIVLESSFKMAHPHVDKKLKSSVLSTLSYAFCLRKDYEKALVYMEQEFKLQEQLGDGVGQCRVLSNLGYTYFKMRKYNSSIEKHRMQVNLAMRSESWTQASMALNAMGHVHAARQDFTSALTSHTRCLEILKQLGDESLQYKELLAIGQVNAMLGDLRASEERYREAEQLLGRIDPEDYQVSLIMLKFNLAHLALKKQSFLEAKGHFSAVFHLAKVMPTQKRKLYQTRASNGMGHTYRLSNEFHPAQDCFEKQLSLANELDDKACKSQALCNLGMIYQHFNDYPEAKNYFEKNLSLVKDNKLLEAYAHSYLGSNYFLLKSYKKALDHYGCSAELFKELDYCPNERKTIDLNLAAVREKLGHCELNIDLNTSHHHNTLTQHKKIMMAS